MFAFSRTRIIAWSFLVWGGFAFPSWAATVVHLNHGRQGPYAAFDAGTKAGFDLGERVCIQDQTGAVVVCGEIVRANASASAMLVPEDVFVQITRGMSVILESEVSSAAASAAVAQGQDQVDSDRANAVPKQPHRMLIGYLYSPRLPVRFDAIGYNLNKAGSAEPWLTKETRQNAPVGFELTYPYPLGARTALYTLLTYQYVPSKTFNLDYSPTDTAHYAKAESLSHNYALGAGLEWMVLARPSFALPTGIGLGILRSTLRQSIQTAGTSEEKLAELDSTLHALTVDMSAGVECRLGGLVIGLNARLSAPVATFATTHTAKTGPSMAGADKESLATHARHETASFGAALTARTGWRF